MTEEQESAICDAAERADAAREAIRGAFCGRVEKCSDCAVFRLVESGGVDGCPALGLDAALVHIAQINNELDEEEEE
jgi:hypothetical protein